MPIAGGKENSMKTRRMESGEIAQHVNPMMMFEENWYLVSAADKGVANTLTAAWGGFGNVCDKKVVTVYIRPQRYTKKFIDASGRFTLTFFNFNDAKIRKALGYLGSHSGADEPDKIKMLDSLLSILRDSRLLQKESMFLCAGRFSGSSWKKKISLIIRWRKNHFQIGTFL